MKSFMADLPKNHSETIETSEGSLQIQKKWRPEEYKKSFLEITLKLETPPTDCSAKIGDSQRSLQKN
jgi:hypothetical protein